MITYPDRARPIPFFTVRELACPETGTIRLAPNFADLLVHLRLGFGHPMPLTSCCRSARYNAEVGGHARSLHVWDDPHHDTGGCCAVDVSTESMHASIQFRLFSIARDSGWSIGHGANFLHLDARTALLGMPRQEWTY